MEEYPEELRTPPVALVSLVGCPDLHATVTTHLHSQQPPLNALALPDFSKISMISRPPKDASLPPQPVAGILKKDWLLKHRTRVPAVVAALFSSDHVSGDPAQWLQVCTDLENLKGVLRGRNVKLVVVVVAPSNSKDYLSEDRMIALRKRAELDSKYVIIFVPSETELQQSLIRLGNTFSELANSFYKDEGRRIKARLEKKNFHSAELNIRCCFKAAVYAEFCRDWTEALRLYEDAYHAVREMVAASTRLPPIQRLIEIKCVAEQLYFKISTLLLHGGKLAGAIVWFRQHYASYRKLVGAPEVIFLHWEWLSRQFLVFAELLETSSVTSQHVSPSVPDATDRATEWEFHSAYYFQLAAHYLKEKNSSLELAQSLSETSGEVDGNAESVTAAAYIGQFAKLLEFGDTFVMQSLSDEEYARYALAEGKRFRDSHEIIALLKRCFEAYNKDKASRMAAFCGFQMAREYFTVDEYSHAKEVFENVASLYRQEGWVTLLWNVLGYLRDCSRKSAVVKDFIEYSLEMAALPVSTNVAGQRDCGPAGPASIAQREIIHNEVFSVIRGASESEPTEENSSLIVTADNPLYLEIDLVSPLRAVLLASVAFHEQVVKHGAETVISLSLLSQLPLNVEIDQLEIQFNQSECNFVIVNAQRSHLAAISCLQPGRRVETATTLELRTNKWLRLTYNVKPGFMMGDLGVEEELSSKDAFKQYVMVKKDRKVICPTQCLNPPANMPSVWHITDIVRQEKLANLSSLSRCLLRRSPENSHQEKEWGEFLGFLQKHKKVATGKDECFQFFILPPKEGSGFSCTFAYYRERGKPSECPVGKASGSTSHLIEDACSPYSEEAVVGAQTCNLSAKASERPEKTNQHNLVRANPSFLTTLAHTHSGWIFGAIAEFVDNSRDAKATKLEVSIDMIFSRATGREIPMLCIIDDGCGMNHQEMLRMVSFGHNQPDVDDPNRIGRFGIGFKTGAMKLGKDALVLTQTSNSRSIAFLSQTLNEGKDNLEIPIVSYYRYGQFMELDKQNETLFKHNLKAIKEFSPFDKYLIGQKVGLFSREGTGTHIYIWNLDEWGSNYSLQWESGITGGSSFHQGDIFIRSRRVRARPGQMTQTVPLDYSLRSYLEVIFLDPRIKIYVQGSQVKSRPLARSLSKTVVENCTIMGKSVQLTLGCNQLEWEQANCGIFLYWHGRLIEAYKRVGSMMHNGDKGRGVIGVIDVTDLMADDNGHVWVHNNKQGFQDCEAYAELETWLGEKSDKYLDEHVDKVELKASSGVYKPDNEWVQCDKCRKWRMLSHGFNSKTLPLQWFCYMKPFNGKCEIPEQEVEPGVITVSSKRQGYSFSADPQEIKGKLSRQAVGTSKNMGGNVSSHTVDDDQANDYLERRKKLRRSCRKS